MRALRLLAQKTPKRWRLCFKCICHSVHGISDKVWKLAPMVLTGLIRCVLSLQSTINMGRLKRVLDAEIRARCRRLCGDHVLGDDALAFRKQVLQTWRPPAEKGRKTSLFLTVTGLLLNGDWRTPKTLIHICKDDRCCASDQECCEKMCYYIPLLLDSLRTSASRGNWAEWSTPMSYAGFGAALHGLVPDVFRAAFNSADQEQNPNKIGAQTSSTNLNSLPQLAVPGELQRFRSCGSSLKVSSCVLG